VAGSQRVEHLPDPLQQVSLSIEFPIRRRRCSFATKYSIVHAAAIEDGVRLLFIFRGAAVSPRNAAVLSSRWHGASRAVGARSARGAGALASLFALLITSLAG